MPGAAASSAMRVLVTGATGYIGGRLIPRLLDKGHHVRVFVRDPRRIAGRAWAGRVEVAVGDLSQPQSLSAALRDMDVAYFLIHGMNAGGDFAARDRAGADNFVRAAGHLKHVIYLGGLVPAGDRVSTHLASRAEVGEIFRASLPTTEFRAGPVIGSGSASFEMVRYLTERLPIMIAPRWVLNTVQPIAVRDVLAYLVSALEHERRPLGVVEIGADVLSFREMMHVYAQVRNLKRVILPVPVLAPWLAAQWVGLVTPIPNRLAVPLIKGVIAPLSADTRRAQALFPDIQPRSYRQAVERALESTRLGLVETRWSGALAHNDDIPDYELTDREGLIQEVRSIHVTATARATFDTFTSLGGDRGWLAWNWAWRARGAFDRLVGGPGLRRGRRDPATLLPGEAVDFWRVEAVEPHRLLRLRAEMKVPGKAWLQFEAIPEDAGCRLIQTAIFAPSGLPGMFYWYTLYPIHKLIFTHMVQAIAREAEAKPA